MSNQPTAAGGPSASTGRAPGTADLRSSGPPPKRRLRNYLLDPRFQLKYTGMVVGVAALVGAVLGAVAYDYSTQQTEALTAELVMRQASMDERAIEKIQSDAEAEDRKVLGSIVGGVLLLCLVLAVTGVFVTHRVVGPAYKMRKLLREVARGRLRFQGKLRKGDELQELFEAFSGMVASLRERQAEEVAMLDEAIARARSAGAPEDAVREVVAVRERMKEALD